MVMIQIDLNDDEDKIVSIHKIENKLETKEQAIKEIIKKSKTCKHKFEVVEKRDGLIRKITQRCVNCGMIRLDSLYSSGTIETSFSKK